MSRKKGGDLEEAALAVPRISSRSYKSDKGKRGKTKEKIKGERVQKLLRLRSALGSQPSGERPDGTAWVQVDTHGTRGRPWVGAVR